MRKDEASICVFIASVIIGILISMNINFSQNNKVFLTPEDYLKAYDERNKLYKDISNLKNIYLNEYLKLQNYKSNDESTYAIMQDFKKELEDNNLKLGLTPIEGEGIKITLNDATTASFGKYYSKSDLIHDSDILGIINDLRNAGAEAICINGQRVIYSTYSYCGGIYIDLSGIKIVAPYYITAIGNNSVLKNYLLLNETHYKWLKIDRSVSVELQELEKIKMPGYAGTLQPKYFHVLEKE